MAQFIPGIYNKINIKILGYFWGVTEKLYASTIGSFMYAMLCIQRDIFYAVRIVSPYKSDPEVEHWIAVKTYTQVSKENERLYVGVF